MHKPRALQYRIRLTTNEKKEHKEKGLLFWLFSAFFSFLFVLFVQWVFPNAIPFDTFQFFSDNQIIAGIKASWPIFAWGIGVTAIVSAVTRNKRSVNHKAEEVLVGGLVVSVIAGLFEELVFRWAIFLSGIAGMKLTNWLFFGFLGFGLAEFLHNWVFGPIVNFVTFGKMKWLIFDMGWAVGAAALAANAKFRNEHKYLGPFGLINSWVIGFFLFWLMFNYGLWTAIIVHFLYDLAIFTIRYLDCAIERHFKMGTPG